MRRGVIAAILMISACAPMEEKSSMWMTLDGAAPLVIAHRGASGYRPEHTLEAYALAIDMGADVVEPDLVFSKDGVLVARHDRYLSTTTDVADHAEFASRKRANDDPADAPREDWWVEDFTLAELKTLRARQSFPGRSKEFDGRFEIPTFDELLALVSAKATAAGRPVGVYPETKHPEFYRAKGYDFEAPLLKALESFDAGPVFIQSFEPEILKRLRDKTGANLVQLVYEAAPGAGPNIPLEEIATYADGVGAAKALIISARGAASGLIEQAHQLGLFLHPWTFRTDQPDAGFALYDGRPIGEQLNSSGVYYVLDPKYGDKIGVDNDAAQEFLVYFLTGADGVFTDFPDDAAKVRDAMDGR